DYSPGHLSLREAVRLANANLGADAITFGGIFSDASADVISLGSALPDLTGELSITGPGADLLTVRRDSASAFRIFTVASGASVEIAGLTIANGNTTLGGGIYNQGNLTVTNSTFSGNSAGGGGGVYNFGMLTVSNSTLSDNSAHNGGGGGVYNDGELTV